MSRHYLLDGYNLIKQIPRLADLPLSDGRARLIRWIEAATPQGSKQNLVTVVFDGNPAHFGNEITSSAKVIFANDQSADDFIKEVIDCAKDKKKFVVVSNDKGITLYVRAQGAQIMSVKEFAADLFTRPKGVGKGSSAKGETTKYIPVTQVQKINHEFEKIWLNEKRDS